MTITPASFPNLPVELQELIVSHIYSPRALASLAQTCKAFYGMTESVLYRSPPIHDGKMDAFAAALERNPTRKTMIQTLDVDYLAPTHRHKDTPCGRSIFSACTFAPLFVQCPRLEELKLASSFNDEESPESTDWNDDQLVDRLPVNWERDQNWLDAAFNQAGLLTAPEERIWKHLESLTLDFQDENNQGAVLLWQPSIFLIPRLEELTIRRMWYQNRDRDALVDSPHRGTTQLKKLALERSAIDHIALRRFLSMPKALTHLTLDHLHMLEFRPPMGGHPYSGDVLEWDDSLAMQKQSLEFISISQGPWDRNHLLETLDGYPNLKVLEAYRYPREREEDFEDELAFARQWCEVRLFEAEVGPWGY